MRESVRQARLQEEQRLVELESERRTLQKDLQRWGNDIQLLSRQLAGTHDTSAAVARLADLQERTAQAERRLAGVREQIERGRANLVEEDEVAVALSLFTPVWETLTPREQAQVLHLLIERVDYDGNTGRMTITFHPTGLRHLAERYGSRPMERIA